jgi:NAD(P)-dependent dehydrogenase (short-subunit alcohol dehydrogenase family)
MNRREVLLAPVALAVAAALPEPAHKLNALTRAALQDALNQIRRTTGGPDDFLVLVAGRTYLTSNGVDFFELDRREMYV